MSINNTQVERIGGKGVKAGRGPVLASLLALAVSGTMFATNFVSDQSHAGVCAGDRCQVVHTAVSTFETGSTTNTLFLSSPFDASASDRGYQTGTGINTLFVLDLVTNNTNASFDCYLGKADTGTGAGTLVFSNVAGTGTIMKTMSGQIVAANKGFGCNTTARIKSNTVLKAAGVFVRSSVLN